MSNPCADLQSSQLRSVAPRNIAATRKGRSVKPVTLVTQD
jgi:hypothetical protein